MRKLMIILAIILTMTVSGFSQIDFGVAGGLNFSEFGGDDIDELNPDMKAGVSGGLYAEIGLFGISVAPEVLYTMKGSNLEFDDVEITTKLTYIEVPVLARLYLPFPIIHPFITAGPYFSTLLTAENEYTYGGETETDDVKDDLESTSTGIKIGAGIKLSRLTLSARYSMGMKNIAKETDLFEMKNKSFELMVHFAL